MRREIALITEIMRFLLVGGIAFIVDFTVLSVFAERVFHDPYGWNLYLATALGFLAGVGVNYVLSVSFVFKAARSNRAAHRVSAFIAFVGLGFIGFLLTEMGMALGVGALGLNYRITKILVAATVLIWNYLSRKLIIFRRGADVAWSKS